MKELFKRSITGILYVFLLLAATILNTDAFDFLFVIFGLVCLYEFKKIIKLSGYYIFIAFMGLWWLYLHLLQNYQQKSQLALILLAACLLTNLYLVSELFSERKMNPSNAQRFLISLFYIGGGCIFLTLIPYYEYHFAKFLIIGIFILIWVNDTFAYIVGRTLGKTKLLPAVSPKKTVEGFVGGVLATLMAGYLLYLYSGELTLLQWLVLTLVVVLTGTLGDLVESKFKRMAGVKDSGAILPGHGGLLDRLDSMIFAAPFAYLTLQIFKYVS